MSDVVAIAPKLSDWTAIGRRRHRLNSSSGKQKRFIVVGAQVNIINDFLYDFTADSNVRFDAPLITYQHHCTEKLQNFNNNIFTYWGNKCFSRQLLLFSLNDLNSLHFSFPFPCNLGKVPISYQSNLNEVRSWLRLHPELPSFSPSLTLLQLLQHSSPRWLSTNT